MLYTESCESLSCNIWVSKVALPPCWKKAPSSDKAGTRDCRLFYGLTFPETLRNLPHSIFLLRRQGMIHEAGFRFCVFLSAFYIVEMYSFRDNRTRCHPSAMQCRESPWMWLSERCVPVSFPTTKRIRTKAGKIKEGEPLQPETLRQKLLLPLEC